MRILKVAKVIHISAETSVSFAIKLKWNLCRHHHHWAIQQAGVVYYWTWRWFWHIRKPHPYNFTKRKIAKRAGSLIQVKYKLVIIDLSPRKAQSWSAPNCIRAISCTQPSGGGVARGRHGTVLKAYEIITTALICNIHIETKSCIFNLSFLYAKEAQHI